MTKIEALAKFLNCDVEELTEQDYDDCAFKIGNEIYLVLTDNEADAAARELILDSVWTFKPSFLAAHTKLGIDEDVIRSIQCNDRCEDNNRVFIALLENVDHFVDDAIRSDGRGHFISSYDGEENEEGEFYIYRTN